MSRQARGRSPTLVEGQTNDTTPKANERPWTRPWWQPSEGNGATLFYIVMIHALALVGLVLFPLPGWRVLAVALAVAAIGGVGTSVCYHRCLAHRSLRLNPVVENMPEYLVAGAIAIGSVGRELAQESSQGCECGPLWTQAVGD